MPTMPSRLWMGPGFADLVLWLVSLLLPTTLVLKSSINNRSLDSRVLLPLVYDSRMFRQLQSYEKAGCPEIFLFSIPFYHGLSPLEPPYTGT